MWGRRWKRGTRLSRLLALGRLEEAMARAERQQEEGGPEAVPYPPAGHPAPDVPVDNSAAPQHHQELPAQRTRDSTRHGSFG